MEKNSLGFGTWVVKHRWLIIIATILMVCCFSSGLKLLKVEPDVRIYFNKENPQLQALEALENIYTKNESVLFVVAPKDGNVFTKKNLSAVEELTEASWKIPYSSRVDSLTNFQFTIGQEDDLFAEDLVQNAKQMTGEQVERIKKIALSEPRLVNRLISPSGHVTAVRANTVRPGNSIKEVPEVAAFARKIANDIRGRYPNIDIYLSGEIIQGIALSEATEHDFIQLLPLMYLVMFVAMFLAVRSFSGTFITFLIILFSAITAVGIGGWIGVTLNPSTSVAPNIILTLAVSDSIHLLTSIFQFMRQGKTRYEAIKESLHINLQPVFLTSVTTAIGFLSWNFTDAPPFRDFGNLVAIGVLAALIYSIFFLPALAAVIPICVQPRPESKHTAVDGLANFVINRSRPLLWCLCIFILMITAGIFNCHFDDEFNKWYDKQFEFRQGTDFLEEHLTGVDMIEYSLGTRETGGIHEPEYLKTVEAFAEWYRKQPHVAYVGTITDIIKRINQDMHGSDKAYFRLPDNRELAAQYLLMYEMSLPFGLDINDRIDFDKSASRVSVILKNSSSRILVDTDKKARKWLKLNAPESMYARGTGLSMMYGHFLLRNTKKMLIASGWTFAIIMGILIFGMRIFKLSLAMIITNIVPVLMTFGIWCMVMGNFGLAVAGTMSMTMGIIVDDTVHFISKYIYRRREYGETPTVALRYVFKTVGHALFTTTMIIAFGFGVLCFSGFKINFDMGLLTVLTVIFALIMDFFLLPLLLLKMEGKTDETFDIVYELHPASLPGNSRR